MAVDALSAALRALSFIALFQAIGIVLFVSMFGRHLTASAEPVRRIGFASALVGMVLLLGQYALEAARMSGDFSGVMDPSMQGLVLHSSAPTVLVLRLLGLLLIAIALRVRSERRRTALGEGAVFAIVSFALMGHTVTNPQRWLLAAMLLAHLVVAAFWFGALIPLYLASKRERPEVAATVAAAFSAVAVWLVPVLFVVGLVLAIFIVKSLAGLRTTYGALLLAKVTGFALLMGLAALNKWRLGPALGRGDARIAATFQRSLALEYALIAAVLSVTAVMTSWYSPE